MKIFISWSGDYSKQCAEILRDWIKCTLQASEPWISSQDIDKGTLWFSEISGQLKDTKIGIVCLTQNNKEKPWILFEAGALAKGLDSNKVCTVLMNLKPTDLDGPLAQFNHTAPTKSEMKSLLTTINKELGDNALKDKILDQVFETYWPSFEDKFGKLKEAEPAHKPNKPTRTSDDMLEEILNTTRVMDKRVRSLEIEKNHRPYLMSKDEVTQSIEHMISSGLDPDEVREHLKGEAPTSFIMKKAIEAWKKRNSDRHGNNSERDLPF